jgi:hypothetical protein
MVNLKVDIPMVIVGVHFAGSFVYPSNSINLSLFASSQFIVSLRLRLAFQLLLILRSPPWAQSTRAFRLVRH